MGAGGKGEIKWDAANDRKLLLMILKISNVKPDYDALAAAMSTPDCKPSAKAVSVRLGKLKAMANSAAGESPSTEKATTPKRKKASLTNDQDEDDDEATPDKKKKLGGKAKAEEGVKKEEEGDDYGFN
ncbi:hypothetical protein LTR27_012131 [Elasticomyces elasticus]|nr:hypothetical protein LTR27_012131 [Elasticomyces elasticus]